MIHKTRVNVRGHVRHLHAEVPEFEAALSEQAAGGHQLHERHGSACEWEYALLADLHISRAVLEAEAGEAGVHVAGAVAEGCSRHTRAA